MGAVMKALGSPAQIIKKNPGDSYQAVITFSYLGPLISNAYIGITLNLGHGAISAFAYTQQNILASAVATARTYTVAGIIPSNLPPGQGYNCMTFISKALPSIGMLASDFENMGGVTGGNIYDFPDGRVWADNVYLVAELSFTSLNATFS